MYYRTKDGTLMGVLNDYDLSSLSTTTGPQGNERTGTVPFMALDLLTAEGQRGEIKHLYRHDLESFVWVLVWICLRYRIGVLLPDTFRPLDLWATVGAERCGKEKDYFLGHFVKFRPADIDPRLWGLIADCLYSLRVFQIAIQRQEYLQDQWPQSEAVDAEETSIGCDDFLHRFTSTKGWVQFSNGLQ